jgi:hypothetical protein
MWRLNVLLVWCYSECISTPGRLWKICLVTVWFQPTTITPTQQISWLNVCLSKLCHASLNSRACLVVACPRHLAWDQSNLCPLSSVCLAGSELWSCLLIAFWCSVSLVWIFLDVCPMYLSGQFLQGNIYINGVMFFRYICLVFVFSEVGPKFACWFVCNVNVEWSEESSCHFWCSLSVRKCNSRFCLVKSVRVNLLLCCSTLLMKSKG